MHYRLKVITILVLVFTALFSVYSKNISDETKMYIAEEPIDYQTHGEDVAYTEWIKKYQDLEQNRQADLQKFSDEYSENLQARVNSTDTSNSTNMIRNSDFQKAPAPLTQKADVINGKKTAAGISYTQKDVYTGGINLARIKQVINGGDINGLFINDGKIFVSIDTNTGNPVSASGLFPDDILVLIRGIFQSKDQSIWQTIDPPEKAADQSKYGVVRYGGMIENTNVGNILFEADRVMKCLSNGYDNRTGASMLLKPWFKSEWNFTPQVDVSTADNNQQQEWHRFWFTSEDATVVYDPVTKAMKIDGRVLKVKTERMFMKNGKLVSSFESIAGTPAQMWVDHFNENFDLYKQEFPVFQELERIARWSSLLLALRECGVIFQNLDLANLTYVDTPKKTAVITVIKERTVVEEIDLNICTSIGKITCIGGVGLQKIKFKKSDLKSTKTAWIAAYDKGSFGVERIFRGATNAHKNPAFTPDDY